MHIAAKKGEREHNNLRKIDYGILRLNYDLFCIKIDKNVQLMRLGVKTMQQRVKTAVKHTAIQWYKALLWSVVHVDITKEKMHLISFHA